VAPATFDVVVKTYFLLRSTFPLLREGLRPGGLPVFETYDVDEIDTLGGDIRREYALNGASCSARSVTSRSSSTRRASSTGRRASEASPA
jgi:hypothetical protein